MLAKKGKEIKDSVLIRGSRLVSGLDCVTQRIERRGGKKGSLGET